MSEFEEYNRDTNPYPSSGKKYNNEKAIISLTSWKARINTVSKTLFSLIKQCPGFHIVLVLSEEEFPQKEKELPENLMVFVENELIELLWVYKNYRSFKKVLFTMDKYRDVPVISADDDVEYQPDIIEKFVELHKKNPDAFIAFRNQQGEFRGQPCTNGGATLYKVSFFSDIFFKIPECVIQTNEDDWWYSYCFWKTGGRKAVFSGIQLKFFNQDTGSLTNGLYNTIRTKNYC